MLGRTLAAYRGTRLWAGLERKYEIDAGVYVIVMPETDAELNTAALAHVEEFVADRRAKGVVLVADRSVPVPAPPAGVVGVESWSAAQIDALLSYFELHNFSDRLMVVSLTKPFGNGLSHLLGRQGITKEDLVCLGCLRLRSYGMVQS